MSEMISCPQCQRQLRVREELLGKRVKCPACNTTFEALPAARPPAPQPDINPTPGGESEERVPSPRPREEDREGEGIAREPRSRRRRTREEDREEEGIAREPRSRRRTPEEEEDYDEDWAPRSRGIPLTRPYAIDMGQWFSFATEHYSAFLGPAIGYLVLYMVIVLVVSFIPIVGPLIRIFLDPPLQAGFFVVALAQLQGRRWTFGDFFSGFNRYGALLGNALLVLLIIVGCMLPTILLVVAGNATRNQTLWQVMPVVAVVNYLVTLYFLIRASFFNIPLILDRNCGPIEAIQASWSLSRGHFWGLLGMALVLGLLVMAGFFLCLVGVLFTVPLAVLAYTAGYLLTIGSPPRHLRARVERTSEYPEEEDEDY